MDRFDLKWPRTDATFYTDGWRCRIVWRQKGGLGGTIDNNDQCVRRVAQSLDGAPYLLSALKARGHDRLADQIEAEAGAVTPTATASDAAAARGPVRAPAKPVPESGINAEAAAEHVGKAEAAVASSQEKTVDEPSGPEKPVDPVQHPVQEWLDGLEGEAAWEVAANRRAKVWTELGTLPGGDEAVLLKAPAPKGKQEWVLKRTWTDRKAEYVASPAFKGVAAWLLEAGADVAFIEQMLGACGGVEHPELAAASAGWRAAQGATH